MIQNSEFLIFCAQVACGGGLQEEGDADGQGYQGDGYFGSFDAAG